MDGRPRTGPGSGAERADLDAALASLLDADPVVAHLDRIGSGAAAHRPGTVIVVAGRSGVGRVHGRDLPLPRRATLALDHVATGSVPGPPPQLGAAVWADPARRPWGAAAADLAEAGLGPPLLVALAEGTTSLGVLACFEPIGGGERSGVDGPDRADPTAALDRLGLRPWCDLAAVALARAADQIRARRAASEDDVTGLPARSLLTARIHEALHRSPRRSVALVHAGLVRLDRTDVLGPDDSDALLRAVARRVLSVVRPGDVVGHLRSSALGVIYEGIGSTEAVEAAERIRVALADPIVLGAHRATAAPSVGVVVADPVDTVNSLVRKAEIAAAEAAERGGASVVRYRPGTYEQALERLGIETDLRRALDEDGLHLVYQPQVSLSDGSIVGVEALVRWDHPTRGSVAPDDFIPIAEETGIVVALGAWAVDTALADIAGGLPFDVSVNLSARQLDDPSLLEHVTGSLHRHAVDPGRLRLEITESALARDPDSSETLLRTLSRLGVRVSIDDFGTGYASLEHLRQTKVADALKIDRTFVAGIVEDPRDRAIVAAAVALGRTLGFKIVAEGVEVAEQARILAEMGCDAAQGYWFGLPVPAAELDAAAAAALRRGLAPGATEVC